MTIWKTATGILLAAVIIALAAAVLLPRLLLDIDAYQAQILTMARTSLNRQVSYESASFSGQFRPSFVFRGITVKEKSGQDNLLTVGQLSFSLALLPLLHKEVRLEGIVLDQPMLSLSRNRRGDFNISDLFEGKPAAFTIYVGTVRITKGLVRFADRLYEPGGLTTTLEHLDLFLDRLIRGKRCEFKLSATLPEEESAATINFTGSISIPVVNAPLTTTRLNLELAVRNLNAWRYWPYYGRTLSFERVRGRLDLEGTFTGTPAEFATKGSLRVRDLRFHDPRVFRTILAPQDLHGTFDVALTPRDLLLKEIDLTVDGLRVTGSCTLQDIPSRDLHITARAVTSPFRLEEFRSFIPFGIISKGTADFIEQHLAGGIYRLSDGRINGRLSQILHMDQGENANVLAIRGHVDKGVMTWGSRMPTLTDIQGELELSGKDFILRRMTGRFGDSPFSLDGRITGYPLSAPAGYLFNATITPPSGRTGLAVPAGEERPAGLQRSVRPEPVRLGDYHRLPACSEMGPHYCRVSSCGTAPQNGGRPEPAQLQRPPA